MNHLTLLNHEVNSKECFHSLKVIHNSLWHEIYKLKILKTIHWVRAYPCRSALHKPQSSEPCARSSEVQTHHESPHRPIVVRSAGDKRSTLTSQKRSGFGFHWQTTIGLWHREHALWRVGKRPDLCNVSDRQKEAD